MLPRADVIQLYTHAAVFCCPSVYEPFGIINLEAMACGTPVVASAVGGILEVVVPEVTGLLVDPGLQPGSFDPADPAAFAAGLAAAVNRLATDAGLRARMAEAGRARVRDHFSWDAIAARTEALYRDVVAATQSHRCHSNCAGRAPFSARSGVNFPPIVTRTGRPARPHAFPPMMQAAPLPRCPPAQGTVSASNGSQRCALESPEWPAGWARLLVEESRAAGHEVVGGTANRSASPDGIPALTLAALAAASDVVIDFTHASTATAHAAAMAASGTRLGAGHQRPIRGGRGGGRRAPPPRSRSSTPPISAWASTCCSPSRASSAPPCRPRNTTPKSSRCIIARRSMRRPAPRSRSAAPSPKGAASRWKT